MLTIDEASVANVSRIRTVTIGTVTVEERRPSAKDRRPWL